MKFAIDTSVFLGAVKVAARFADKRAVIKVATHVCVAAKGEVITVRGTDLYLETQIGCSASIESEGAACVPADMLLGFLQRIPAGSSVTVETEESRITLKSGRSKITLAILDAADFPLLQFGSDAPHFEIEGGNLSRLLAAVTHAQSTSTSRLNLWGVFVAAANGELTAVAADGVRLAIMSRECAISEIPGVIIPTKTISEIMKLAGESEKIKIAVSSTMMTVEAGSARIVSRLVDGTFPEYTRYIPARASFRFRVDKESILSAASRVSLVEKNARGLKLECFEDRAVISCGSAADDAIDEIGCDGDGQCEFGVNSKYLIEALASIDDENCIIELTDRSSPIVIRGASSDRHKCVMMPCRI